MFKNIVGLNLILFAVSGVIVLAFQGKIESWFGFGITWTTLAIFSSILSTFTDLFLTKLRMDENPRSFGKFNVFISASSAALTVLFVVLLKWGWEGRVYSLFLGALLSGIISFYFIMKVIKDLGGMDFKSIYKIFIFGLPLLPHTLSLWIRRGFDKIFITASYGLAENGVYSFAMTISIIFTMASNAFFSAFSPHIYKKLSLESTLSEEEFYKLKINIVKKSYMFLIAFLLFLIIGGVLSALFILLFFRK